MCGKFTGAHPSSSGAGPTISEDLGGQAADVKNSECPVIPLPLGLSLGGDGLSASEKFELLSRSTEYLQLRNALGDETLSKPDAKRCRVSLPKRNFDAKFCSYLKEFDLKPEAILWLQRLKAHWDDDVSSIQVLSSFPGAALPQSSSPTPGQDEVILQDTIPPPPALPGACLTQLIPPPVALPEFIPPLPLSGSSSPLPLPLPLPLSSSSPLLEFLSSVAAPSNVRNFDASLIRLYNAREDFLRAHTIQKVCCVRGVCCVLCVVCVCVVCAWCVCIYIICVCAVGLRHGDCCNSCALWWS